MSDLVMDDVPPKLRWWVGQHEFGAVSTMYLNINNRRLHLHEVKEWVCTQSSLKTTTGHKLVNKPQTQFYLHFVFTHFLYKFWDVKTIK